MSLIKCHECGGQVSDHAQTCPKCGAPVIATIKRRQKATLIELAIRLALAAVIGITFWLTWQHILNKPMAPLRPVPQQQQPTH